MNCETCNQSYQRRNKKDHNCLTSLINRIQILEQKDKARIE